MLKFLILLISCLNLIKSLDNGLGLTPQMGNFFELLNFTVRLE